LIQQDLTTTHVNTKMAAQSLATEIMQSRMPQKVQIQPRGYGLMQTI